MTIGSRWKWWWGQWKLMSGLLGAELTDNLHHSSSAQSPYSAPKIPGAGSQCGSNPSEGAYKHTGFPFICLPTNLKTSAHKMSLKCSL